MAVTKPKLEIGVKQKTWRAGYEPADHVFQSVRDKVLERDRHACVFCGFHSRKWQQVHHVDDDHVNNALENLVTICSYCHMNFHIGKAGQDGAFLAFLPELSPEAISHIWRAVAAAMAYPSWLKARAERGRSLGTIQVEEAMALYDAAADVLRLFESRRDQLRSILGTASPQALGDALLAAARTEPSLYDSRSDWLYGVRLVPPGPDGDFGGKEMIAYFLSAEGPFGDALRPGAWSAMARSLEAGRSLAAKERGGR